MPDDPLQPMQPLAPRLKFTLNFDPDADIEAWRLTVPAKPACYVLCDRHDQPILLATTGNLRTALVHRLAGGAVPREPEATDDAISSAAPSPRTDYRAITRIIRYRPCCSAFEADWAFLENAPLLFPRQFRPMIQHLRTHWITLNTHDTHPRFHTTTQPDFSADTRAIQIGPIPTSTNARQIIDALEDLSDLCRHHEILVLTPNAAPCAYKEMGKCPAPCDGSISLSQYHNMIAQALALLTGQRDAWVSHVHQHMKQAASDLKFELASRWKLKLDRLASLDHPALRLARPLPQWRGCFLLPGSRKHALRPFIITPGSIVFPGEITPKQQDLQLTWFNARLPTMLLHPPAPDELSPYRMALLARHLFKDNPIGRWSPHIQPLSLDPSAPAPAP